jgi:dTDP-4-amino-4,6-dideoxygalactose transaminase
MSRSKFRIARPYMDESITKGVLEVLQSGRLVQGAFVARFEAKLAEYLGSRNVVALSSGTAALHAAIAAVRDRAGMRSSEPEVIATPLSFSATANAVMHAGCRPVFVDVDEGTFNIDADLIEEKIGDRTIAIEPVDVYGLPADLNPILSLAKKRGLAVVEDAAEAIGASYHGRKVGTISTVTCFSTYATKNLQTGEGGFVATGDSDFAQYIRLFRNQGQVSKYNQQLLGYNYRMLEASAAIGLPQVSLIDSQNARRRENALRLKSELEGLDCLSFQRVDEPAAHAWYMFAMLLDEKKAAISRDKLVLKLNEAGVEADVAWPRPIHLQPYYRARYGFKEGDYPKAEQVCKRIIQLPIQPFLTSEDIQEEASIVRKLLPH